MLLHVTAGKLICADNGETIMGRFFLGGGLVGINPAPTLYNLSNPEVL
jgi:hypothetical protein